jgi:hypothetical protein
MLRRNKKENVEREIQKLKREKELAKQTAM